MRIGGWISYPFPTRLLDGTYSPFIVPQFATARIDQFDRDGVVWSENELQTHEFVPDRLRSLLDEGKGSAPNPVDLCLSLFPWALFRSIMSAVKLQDVKVLDVPLLPWKRLSNAI